MVFAQDFSVIQGLVPQATDGNPLSAWCDISDAVTAFILVHVTKGDAALTSFQIREGNTATGGGAQNLAGTALIWSNLNSTATNVLTRRTNDSIYALDNASDGRGQIVLFQVDPARLSAGFMAIAVQVAAGNADNIASLQFLVERKNKVA